MTQPLLQKGNCFGRYLVQGQLGRGGMGEVYLAEDTKHHRRVALKVLLPEEGSRHAATRFRREIGIVAALTHPHILPLYDSGEVEGRLFYVMPFVDGGSLRQRLEREGRLPVETAVRIVQQVADAIGHAHDQGIVHRDIKPENILFEGEHPVVVDFGVARAVLPAAGESLTTEGFLIGTPAYMSPEQAGGDRDIGPASDQYALACVLYEMLAGQPPFVGPNNRAILGRHLIDQVPPLASVRPGISRPVRRAIMRALAKAPPDRFATIRQFAAALSAPDQADDAGPSVAVLPFVSLSPDPEDQYFAVGMAEEILGTLARMEGLRVASRAASFGFKTPTADVRDIGECLNVAAVLEGRVRREGDSLHIQVQLSDAANGLHLWTAEYHRTPQDVFAIQEDMAASVARALGVALPSGSRPIARGQPSDLDAYDFYLRGLQFLHQGTRKSLRFARQMFERALERDPDFARGYAGVAQACAMLRHYYPRHQDDQELRLADQASRRALELDPSLADAHATRGFVLWLLDRFEEAETEFRQAVALDPDNFEARYLHARASFQRGDLEQAARLFEEAGRVREDHEAYYFTAQTLSALGRREDAEAAYRRALPVIERHLALNPDDARALTMGAVCFSRLGDRSRGLEWAERATAVDPEDARICYNVACLFALEGERQRAIERLGCALKAGFAHRDWIVQDPDLASLRDDPEFQELIGGPDQEPGHAGRSQGSNSRGPGKAGVAGP